MQLKNKVSIHMQNLLIGIFILSSFISCIGQVNNKDLSKRSSKVNSNDPSNVGIYQSRILKQNPIILSGNYNLDPEYDLGNLLSEPVTITTNQSLRSSCSIAGYTQEDCFEVRENSFSVAPITYDSNQKWAFDVGSSEFHQVQTFYHVNQITEKYFTALYKGLQYANPSMPNYSPTAYPSNLLSKYAFWLPGKTLKIYAVSGTKTNAYFSPSNFTIGIGEDEVYTNLKWAQDPSIIYHESGHMITHVMLNARNSVSSSVITNSDLGYIFYDEAAALGEGISDYFSYFMNDRTHLGEWTTGMTKQSRPISEDDSLHAPGISKTPDGRLSYPTYLNYEPNDVSILIENVHNAGMIISHYLVALTEDLKTTCNFSQTDAKNTVIHAIFESFSELGDLTAKGSDSASTNNYMVNLNPNHASEWLRIANPINYRSFAQRMAKYLFLTLNNYNTSTSCNSTFYHQDRIEQLLDQYGLLLFKTYNEDGNGVYVNGAEIEYGHNGVSTLVNTSNRLNTTLVPKEFVKLDPTPNATQTFIFDNKKDLYETVRDLRAGGAITRISPLIPDDLSYNNGKGNISPGEIVGVLFNLYNDSNSTIGGVQLLANDWDHVKGTKPCNNFEDQFPLLSEGAADAGSFTNPGDCEYISRSNGDEVTEDMAPICLVQLNEDNANKWVTQSEFVNSSPSLEPEHCLGGASDTKACLIRVIPNVDQAFYSKIDPKSTWADSISASGQSVEYKTSNIIMLETSPWIAPGTTFNCRVRVRFTNCDDCFTDPNKNDDDRLDYEYSGGDPFKIVHFKFVVIN